MQAPTTKEVSYDTLPAAVQSLQTDLSEIKRLLLERSEPPTEEKDELLTIQEAATFLKLSVPTVYNYVHKKLLPVSKRQKRLYFSKNMLYEWVMDSKRHTNKEVWGSAKSAL